MTTNYYQTPTRPTLYASYLLYQYASGALDKYGVPAGISIGTHPETLQDMEIPAEPYSPLEMIRMLQLEPSRTSYIYDPEDRGQITMNYKLVPDNFSWTPELGNDIWKNINSLFLLGHNFADCEASITFGGGDTDSEDDFTEIATSNAVNNISEPEYNGWSLTNFSESANYQYFKIRIRSRAYQDDFLNPFVQQPLKLGSLFLGNRYTFPINCNMNTKTSYDYGVKRSKTISGKTLSKANWTKPNSWGGYEPFGLSVPFDPSNNDDNFLRRTGLRTWSISFDSLNPSKVMNQNPMLNTYGWTSQDTENDNITGEGDSLDNIIGVTSTFASPEGNDFFTSIVHRSLGGHLPMLLQLDRDNYSPHNFAIVRMNPNYTITQKSPNLYNIKIVLEEQV